MRTHEEESVVVLDIETIPDLAALACHQGRSPDDLEGAREELGGAFPKSPFHKIVAIGMADLDVVRNEDGQRNYGLRHLSALRADRMHECELVERALDHISSFGRVVTFNGTGFDLPVLRYRAMAHALSAPRLDRMNLFHRFAPSHVDLCDRLASFGFSSKASLDQICKALRLPGKGGDIDGSKVASMVADGRFDDISGYVQSDVVNTTLLFLRYELFRGAITSRGHVASQRQIEADLRAIIARRPHLETFLGDAAKDVPLKYRV